MTAGASRPSAVRGAATAARRLRGSDRGKVETLLHAPATTTVNEGTFDELLVIKGFDQPKHG